MKKTNQIFWEIYQGYECSRTDFCKMLGYEKPSSNVSQWLNGRLDLSLDQLEKFCNKLNIKFTYEVQIN